MFKSLVALCVVFFVVTEARPKWQFLPPMQGYVPVYIRTGDTPLEEINPDLAEAFHAQPVGRSAGKHVDASPETPELADQPPAAPEPYDSSINHQLYEKQVEYQKKISDNVVEPIERR